MTIEQKALAAAMLLGTRHSPISEAYRLYLEAAKNTYRVSDAVPTRNAWEDRHDPFAGG